MADGQIYAGHPGHGQGRSHRPAHGLEPTTQPCQPNPPGQAPGTERK
jgi:hypothetical protein